MSTANEFRLPDVGEGLTEAEIVRWMVAVGDRVERNQPIVEIETAKSLVELPSPFEGTVAALHAEEGSTVEVGSVIITIEDGEAHGGGAAAAADAAASTDTADPAGSVPPAQPADDARAEPAPAVLVGYGPSESPTRRRARRPVATTASESRATPHAPPRRSGAPSPDGPVPTLAKPPVRRLAKDLGIDLTAVPGTGPHNRILRDDVLAHADGAAAAGTAESAGAAEPAPAARDGAATALDGVAAAVAATTETETRSPVKGVRKATAEAMSRSAFTAPHVTEFYTVDVTRSVELVEQLRADPAFENCSVTMLLLVARALLAAIRQYPEINASWDDENQEIVRYHHVNLGIAAATPRGLMVPNVKDAGAKSLPELAAALTSLVRTARDGKSTPEDMSRGTITITNIGVFGVDAGTPILNPGEAAILCVGAVRRRPWEYEGEIALRELTQLSLSFDHRLVDGELGSKVLARVGRILENPSWELLLS